MKHKAKTMEQIKIRGLYVHHLAMIMTHWKLSQEWWTDGWWRTEKVALLENLFLVPARTFSPNAEPFQNPLMKQSTRVKVGRKVCLHGWERMFNWSGSYTVLWVVTAMSKFKICYLSSSSMAMIWPCRCLDSTGERVSWQKRVSGTAHALIP